MLKSVDEALAVIREKCERLGTAVLSPADAGGHVLAEDLLMGADSPPFDRALLDGFAVRAEDARVGAALEMIGRQDAGGPVWNGVLTAGKCVGINTGAVLPAGADAVLMVEHSSGGEERHSAVVTVLKEVRAEQGIQRRGAQGRVGQAALAAGVLLSPAAVGAAVSAGAASLTVWRKSRVAVLSTGDELAAAGETLRAGQIHNSNQPMLLGLVRASGHEAVDLGMCGDVREALRARLERGLAEADMLVVTGGMSMGTLDLVPALLKELGVEAHVEKVRMKPGKPFLFGTVQMGGARKYVAGLPGNPVSAFVTFQLFVREVLERLEGREVTRWMEGEAGGEFEANGDREFFQPCVVSRRGAMLVAEPLAWRGSADLLMLSRAHGLARRAANAPPLLAGERVEIVLI